MLRTYNDILQEIKIIDDNLEKNGNGETQFKKGKLMGESIQLEQFSNDLFELLEWIKQHEEKIDKDKLVSKIQGEVIM